MTATAVASTQVGSCLSICSSKTASSVVIKAPRTPRLHLYDFKQLKALGGGAYGNVYLVQHIPTGLEVAMKVVDKRWGDCKMALREQTVLRQVGTKGIPGVMEFLGSFHNPRHFFMLMVGMFFSLLQCVGDISNSATTPEGICSLSLSAGGAFL